MMKNPNKCNGIAKRGLKAKICSLTRKIFFSLGSANFSWYNCKAQLQQEYLSTWKYLDNSCGHFGLDHFDKNYNKAIRLLNKR